MQIESDVSTETRQDLHFFGTGMIIVILESPLSVSLNDFLLDMIQATINCGYKDTSRPDWLIPMDKDKLPQPVKEMFPKKAKFQVSSFAFVYKGLLMWLLSRCLARPG